MFKNVNTNQLFHFLYNRFKYGTTMQLLEVDFQKPWWDLLLRQKWLVFINIFNQFLSGVVIALIPLLLATVIESRNVNNFLWLVLGLIGFRVVAHCMFYFDPIFRLQNAQSITYSASKFFLNTDPINHSTRSSGEVVSKVSRAASGMENMLGIAMFDFLSLFFTILGTVGAFWSFDFRYGLLTFGIFFVVVSLNIIGFLFRSRIQKTTNEAEDKTQAINLESLQQVNYIRSVFATVEQDQNMRKFNFQRMSFEATGWRMAGWIITSTQFLFLAGMGLLGYLMLSDQSISILVISSLLISYFNVAFKLFFIGHSVNSMIKAYIGVVDLFDYIRGFGKQSFPVLEEDGEIQNAESRK